MSAECLVPREPTHDSKTHERRANGSFTSFSGRCNLQDDSILMFPELHLSAIHSIFSAVPIVCQGLGVLSGLFSSVFNLSHLMVKECLKIFYF